MFENVSFNVNEGDIIVLQARSGSGCVVSIQSIVPVASKFIVIIIWYILCPTARLLS